MPHLALGLDWRRYNVDVVSAPTDDFYMVDVPALLKLVALGCGLVLNRAKTIRRIPALIIYLRSEMPYVMLTAQVVASLVCLCARRFARRPELVIVNERNELSTTMGNASIEKQRSYPAIALFVYPRADNERCWRFKYEKMVDQDVDLLFSQGGAQ